jgi:GH24 family phage-related lysozyme (muramidase)|tara:strand:+ start:267 stop:707 length:441 start_codon:yes stop_codon:yes gene_type:complete
MDIQKLKEELTLDEGCEFKLYNDHLGYKTFGIGHLVTKDDPEYEMEIGEEVNEERVNECFVKDVEKVIEDCTILYDNFYELPEGVQLIIANMMFNLGRPRLTKFAKMRQAVIDKDWFEASVQMQDSRWYKQVPNRAKRLVERMRKT